MKIIPLDDLEIYDLFLAAYPDKFPDDDDETWESIQQFADDLSGFDDIADLLGRVVMLTMPMKSPLSGDYAHCLGNIEIKDDKAFMSASIRRKVDI